VNSGAGEDDTCQLRSEVNNASMYLSARLPDTALASSSSSSSCGSEGRRPWTVSVMPGQFITFTLIDMSASRSRLHVCYVYALLVERAVERVELCAGQQANVTYTSASNVVNVTLYHQMNQHVNYLLKYEGIRTRCWYIYYVFEYPLNISLTGKNKVSPRWDGTIAGPRVPEVWTVKRMSLSFGPTNSRNRLSVWNLIAYAEPGDLISYSHSNLAFSFRRYSRATHGQTDRTRSSGPLL